MCALVIGDIGLLDGMMHIGDEAMFEVAAAELGSRGLSVVGVSANPAESASRYGIETVPRLGFGGLSREAAAARAAMLVDAAAGLVSLPDDDVAAGALAVLRGGAGLEGAGLEGAGLDGAGLIVAGGGNLASRWPEHIFERTTLAAMARALGRPVVVSGQTLGPDLIDDDAARVAEMLRGAVLAGVREPTSLALAASWGIDARLGVDDASFLGDDDDAAPADRSGVLVSLSGWFGGLDSDDTEAAIAALIDAAAAEVGGDVRFHAHFGPADAAEAPRGDAALHERIRSRMRSASVVVPTGDSVDAARLARSASLLITSRYHPAVFAAPAGVAVLGLVADDYTRIKQQGVLGHWSGAAAGSTTLDLSDLRRDGATTVAALVSTAPAITAAAAARRHAHRVEFDAWWDAVAAAISHG